MKVAGTKYVREEVEMIPARLLINNSNFAHQK